MCQNVRTWRYPSRSRNAPPSPDDETIGRRSVEVPVSTRERRARASAQPTNHVPSPLPR